MNFGFLDFAFNSGEDNGTKSHLSQGLLVLELDLPRPLHHLKEGAIPRSDFLERNFQEVVVFSHLVHGEGDDVIDEDDRLHHAEEDVDDRHGVPRRM